MHNDVKISNHGWIPIEALKKNESSMCIKRGHVRTIIYSLYRTEKKKILGLFFISKILKSFYLIPNLETLLR